MILLPGNRRRSSNPDIGPTPTCAPSDSGSLVGVARGFRHLGAETNISPTLVHTLFPNTRDSYASNAPHSRRAIILVLTRPYYQHTEGGEITEAGHRAGMFNIAALASLPLHHR